MTNRRIIDAIYMILFGMLIVAFAFVTLSNCGCYRPTYVIQLMGTYHDGEQVKETGNSLIEILMEQDDDPDGE